MARKGKGGFAGRSMAMGFQLASTPFCTTLMHGPRGPVKVQHTKPRLPHTGQLKKLGK
jgi:hypothetical protein